MLALPLFFFFYHIYHILHLLFFRFLLRAPQIVFLPPAGLEYLTHVDQVLVKQKVEVFELLTGCEMKNKYIVQNSMGQQVFFIQEDVDCCTR